MPADPDSSIYNGIPTEIEEPQRIVPEPETTYFEPARRRHPVRNFFILVIALAVAGVLGRDVYRKLKPAPPGEDPDDPPPVTEEQMAASDHERHCDLLVGSHGKMPFPNMQLSGTVVSADQSVAVFADGKSPSVVVKVGDYVGDTCWRLRKVDADSATLWSPVSPSPTSKSGQLYKMHVTADPGHDDEKPTRRVSPADLQQN